MRGPTRSIHQSPRGQCEYISETDPAVLRVVLKVRDGGGYSWVTCGGCDMGWQVPHFAESVG